MHLWPSMRIRDSFKIAYLKKLEWNLHRMNSDKKRSQESTSNTQDKLLDDQENGVVNGETPFSNNSCLAKTALIFREIIMISTCCYCCFFCGACVDQDRV